MEKKVLSAVIDKKMFFQHLKKEGKNV